MIDPSLKSIDALFSPKSIAVIGASESFGKWGFDVIHHIVSGGGDFAVYPINPKREEVFGLPAYPSVLEVQGELDLAVIVVPPEQVQRAMDQCIRKGVRSVLVITAGFKEVGRDGAALEADLAKAARSAGLRFVGPNCNGHFNTAAGVFSLGSPRRIKPGGISLVSQSGNFGEHIVTKGWERGIGFAKCVSSGNEADLTVADFIEYLGEDPHTQVICAYIEGIKNGRRFVDLAREVSRRKPIVVMKGGNSPEGACAARSHTGALSGEAAINDGVFRQAGIIQVNKVQEMLDVASAFLRQPLPAGNRIGIITAGGGFGVIATDACRSTGLQVPALSSKTLSSLSRWMPSRWSKANPVDMAGDPFYSMPAIGGLLKSDDVDAVLAVSCLGFRTKDHDEFPATVRDELIAFQNQTTAMELEAMGGLIERVDRHGKPLIVAAVTPPGRSRAIARLVQEGIYPYESPEDGARVLSCLVQYSQYLARRPSQVG